MDERTSVAGVPVNKDGGTVQQNSRVISLTAADVTTGAIALVVVAGIVALAIRQQPIPDILIISLTSIIAYYFGRSSRV